MEKKLGSKYLFLLLFCHFLAISHDNFSFSVLISKLSDKRESWTKDMKEIKCS